MYTTLARVKAELKTTGTATTDDAKLLNYIGVVTQRIRGFGYDFEPQYGVEYFTAFSQYTNINRGTLELVNGNGQKMLLASSTDVPSIVSDNTTFTYGTQVFAWPRGNMPIRTLRLNDADATINTTWYPRNGRAFYDTILITGWWGYREQYETFGWLASGQTILNAAGITASGTSITVTDPDAADALFRTPAFSAGNLIRVENEMMLVMATDSTANTLTVRRGVNGSTAAAHALATPISIWEWEPDIVQAATRQAALLYARRGSFTSMEVAGAATATYPRDLLAELYATMQRFQYT